MLLEVSHVGPIDLYQLDDRNTTWIAEWTPLLESPLQYCGFCDRYTLHEGGMCIPCIESEE